MQTLYIGNTLINDIFLGSQRIDDALRVDPNPYALPPVTNGLEVYLTTYTTASYASGSSAWVDLSGNSRDFKLANTVIWPSGSLTGIVLGSTGSKLSTATYNVVNGLPFTFNTQGTFFYVIRQAPTLDIPNNAGAMGSINNSGSTNNDFTNYQRHAIGDENPQASVYTSPGQQNLKTLTDRNSYLTGSHHLIYAAWTTGSNNGKISIDKFIPDTGTMATFTNSGSMRISIGTNATLTGVDNAGCAFFEVAYYSRKLTDSELSSSVDYFCNRYSIV